MTRWLRAPLLHFVLVGGGLFALDAWRGGRTDLAAARPAIVVTAAQIAELREEHRRQTGAPPSPDEEAALVARAVDEELLYREALARGLDRGDRSIRWRLAEKMRFLGDGAETPDPGDLYRRALALGLDRDDAIVRRILVEKMRLLADLASPAADATDAELRDYLERHREQYLEPARVSFRHVFLSAERRGARLAADARALREDLGARPAAPAQAIVRGDPFPLAVHVRSASAQQVAKLFGSGFAEAVERLQPGSWSGPIASAFGLHLVWVESREPAALAPLEAVRSQIAAGLRAERQKERVAELLTRLRRQYEVQVEG
jgi:hypothetical protein